MADQPTADQSVIEAFKVRARNFWNQWNILNNSRGVVARQSPEMQQQYRDLVDRGSTIRSSVETVTRLIDKATSAYRTATGWASGFFSLGEMPTLGVIPLLVPAAVIAGSLAAMGKWLKDVYEFNRKLEEIARLEAKGVDPVTASKIVERVSDSGSFNIKAAVGLPVLLIGGFLAYNMFKGK
jgi:hypothetical protein